MRKYTITIETHVSEEALTEKLAELAGDNPRVAELTEEKLDLFNINGFLGGTVAAIAQIQSARRIMLVPGETFTIGTPEDKDFYISVKVTQ